MRYLLIVIISVSLSACAHFREDPSTIKVGRDGNVEVFYGVPIDLSVSELGDLPYSKKIGIVSKEGDEVVQARLTAMSGVELSLVFDLNNKLYYLETSSPKAFDPRGISVGTLISKVRSAWPNGRLIHGSEEGGYITYLTGTNVLFDLEYRGSKLSSPNADLKDEGNEEIIVKSIRITHIAVPIR
jgi:hypothetical protein